MKKIFQYIGVISLMIFSFYYTEKVAKLMNKEDVIMKSIEEYASINDKKCVEGSINEEGVILGVSGEVVDKNLSYSLMLPNGFDENLIEYKANPCVVSKKNNIDDYIIGGNKIKNSISLIIDIKTGKNLERIISISESKKIKLSLLVDYNYYDNNKEYLLKLINNGYDILYKGNDESEIKTMKKELYNTFCVYTKEDNLKSICSKNNINTIKTNRVYSDSFLANVKTNLKKGDLIILNETGVMTSELSVIINYIKSRGLKVLNISEHLSD